MVEKLRTKITFSEFLKILKIIKNHRLTPRWTLILPKPSRKVSDPPKISKIRSTSKSCSFVTTEPIPKFLVSRMSSSSWNVRKWYLQPDILISTHPSGTKREADFRKIPNLTTWPMCTTPHNGSVPLSGAEHGGKCQTSKIIIFNQKVKNLKITDLQFSSKSGTR